MILIIQDDEGIIALMEAILERLPYEYRFCRTAQEATLFLGGNLEKISLVFWDEDVPESALSKKMHKTTEKLLASAKTLLPKCPMVAMSSQPSNREIQKEKGCQYEWNPLEVVKLEGVIEEALAASIS